MESNINNLHIHQICSIFATTSDVTFSSFFRFSVGSTKAYAFDLNAQNVSMYNLSGVSMLSLPIDSPE